MGTPTRPVGAGSGLGSSQHSSLKPAPKGYGARWYPPRGVDPCRKCGDRPAFLAASLKTGKLRSFQESGMPHGAVCRGVSPAARRWHAEEAE